MIHANHQKKEKIQNAISTLHNDANNEQKAVRMLKELGFNDEGLTEKIKQAHEMNVNKFLKELILPNEQKKKQKEKGKATRFLELE